MVMKRNNLNVLIGGEAGQGIVVSSLTLAKVFTRGGLYAFILNEYPNTIKGLHNWCSIRVSDKPLTSHTAQLDLIIALNKDTILIHKDELKNARGLIYDPDDASPEELLEGCENLALYPIPLNQIIKSLNADKLMRNSIAVGAALALVDYDFKLLSTLLSELFQHKGQEIVTRNLAVARAGYDYIKQNFSDDFGILIKKQKSPPLMLLSGNEAAGMGAVQAGAKLLAAYPMTPTSPIIHYMAANQLEFDCVVKHTEDEIAAINMAIGGGFAGARSFVCTSGGGFALMTEALGLAAITETPVVCIMGQRPGPSTGQPTHTSQGDLRFVIHASQDEFPRIVIAPGDNRECFYETFNAFNLAEKFQIPIIILTDKFLGESYRTCPKFDTSQLKIERGKLLEDAELERESDYRRYAFTRDGISPRAVPGQKNGIHTATSYEHDEYGFYEETPLGVEKMIDKRFSKLAIIERALPVPNFFGQKNADITLISWGSTKGVILEAMRLLKGQKIKVNFCQLVYIYPFPAEQLIRVMEGAKKVVVIENNKTGQLAGLIKEHTGMDVDYKYLKYDGQPFNPTDVCNYLRGACNSPD